MKIRIERLMTHGEITTVLANLRSGKSISARWRLILVRLAACCGLRRGEISELRVADVITGGIRPGIVIRKEIAKSKRERYVPLWWDKGTRDDLTAWLADMDQQAYVLGSTGRSTKGHRVHPGAMARRWRSAIKCLGPSRVRQLSIHAGRHSFVSHALHRGRSLAEVRDAAGHVSVATTEVYLHTVEREVPDIWA